VSADLSSARDASPWIAICVLASLLAACDPHAESAGSDNSTESGTAGSASDEGATPDAMGRKSGEDPGSTTAPQPGDRQLSQSPAGSATPDPGTPAVPSDQRDDSRR
jgi:hypothetical protein